MSNQAWIIIGATLASIIAWLSTRKKTKKEVESTNISDAIKINEYVLKDRDIWQAKYSACQMECNKYIELNSAQRKYISQLEEQLRVIQIQKTLLETLNT